MAHYKKKLIFVEINVALLNPHGQTQTTNYITLMLCTGLYPSITLPSRITTNSATLIHNTFTNVTEGKLTGGLILTVTSDHLPVFVTLESNSENPKDTESEGLETKHFRRLSTESAIDSLQEDLINQDWSNIYVDDVDEPYDKHCPLVANLDKNKYMDKLWLTKGIQNAWKKKNSLYRVFLKLRTQEAEEKYKTYRNKLIINIVGKFKNKKSTDRNGFDMFLIKKKY